MSDKVETIYPGALGVLSIPESDGSVTEVVPAWNGKYRAEYCEGVVNYFRVEHTQEVVREVATPKGPINIMVDEGAKLPTLAGFAASIGVSTSTIATWRKKYPEFGAACEVALAHQEDMLINNSIRGKYAAAPSIFAAKNLIGWKDKLEHSGDKDNPINHRFVIVPAKAPIGSTATPRLHLDSDPEAK
jgi:hypothetical protein